MSGAGARGPSTTGRLGTSKLSASRFLSLAFSVLSQYILIVLFQVAWAIIGLVWYGDEGDACRDDARPLLHAVLAGAIILLVFVGVFLIGLLCSVYSGFITVCVNDWSVLKCLFCWVYYPFIYNHERVREKYYGQHNLLQPRSPPAAASINNNQAARSGGGPYAPPQQAARNNQPLQPPQQYGVIPAAQPQNMGGQVYRPPAIAAVQQPVYQQPPVNYQQQQPSPQYQQAAASPVYQQQPQSNMAPQPAPFQSQEQLLAQYRPAHAPQAYQPAPQQFSPYHEVPMQQQQQQHQPPQQYYVEPIRQQQPHHQQEASMPMHAQIEGQPNDGFAPAPMARADMPHAPGGVASSAPAPAVIPVAQPIAQQQQQQQQRQPEQKSAVAMARESALSAAASVKSFLKK